MISSKLKFHFPAALLLLSLFIGLAPDSRAALGGRTETVEEDRAHLGGTSRTTENHSAFSVHEFRSGLTTVREYADSDGMVFGIAWIGLTHPDLSHLLGTHYAHYQVTRAAAAPTHHRVRAQVRSDRMVVETWGHMRKLQGRAYLGSQIPQGVTADDIH